MTGQEEVVCIGEAQSGDRQREGNLLEPVQQLGRLWGRHRQVDRGDIASQAQVPTPCGTGPAWHPQQLALWESGAGPGPQRMPSRMVRDGVPLGL